MSLFPLLRSFQKCPHYDHQRKYPPVLDGKAVIVDKVPQDIHDGNEGVVKVMMGLTLIEGQGGVRQDGLDKCEPGRIGEVLWEKAELDISEPLVTLGDNHKF